jgi:hypothetical protein
MVAFAASAAGSWVYNVALTVWIFDATGSVGWVAAATIGRFVPAMLFSAYGMEHQPRPDGFDDGRGAAVLALGGSSR